MNRISTHTVMELLNAGVSVFTYNYNEDIYEEQSYMALGIDYYTIEDYAQIQY